MREVAHNLWSGSLPLRQRSLLQFTTFHPPRRLLWSASQVLSRTPYFRQQPVLCRVQLFLVKGFRIAKSTRTPPFCFFGPKLMSFQRTSPPCRFQTQQTEKLCRTSCVFLKACSLTAKYFVPLPLEDTCHLRSLTKRAMAIAHKWLTI